MRNQESKLALNTLILGALGYASRQYGGWALLALVVFAVWAYFRPAINSWKFWVSYTANLALFLLAPLRSDSELVLLSTLFFASISGLILGSKNLIFLKRKVAHQISIFMLISGLTLLFFADGMGVWSMFFSVAVFILMTYEHYSSVKKDHALLFSVVSGLVYSELLWAVSVLPLSYAPKAALALSATLLGKDILMHHLRGDLSLKIIARNVILIVFASLVIIGSYSGKLS